MYGDDLYGVLLYEFYGLFDKVTHFLHGIILFAIGL